MNPNLSPDQLETLRPLLNDLLVALEKAHLSAHRIEILPDFIGLPGDRQVEIEESNIFIKKATLVKAFLAARYRYAITENQADKYAATSVLLLLHPQYDTAVNFRKETILSLSLRNGTSGAACTLIQRDLCYLETLFRSPLNRHTKSPTLWSHRRWLLQYTYEQLGISPNTNNEVSIVLAAAETHPRNYYAWSYLRWFLNFSALISHKNIAPISTPSLSDNDNVNSLQLRSTPTHDIQTFQQWCLSHPSDTSGWSFFDWLLTTSHTISPKSCKAPEYSNTFQEVLQTAMSLRLRNEAIWGFLRTLSTKGDVGLAVEKEFVRGARELFGADAGNEAVSLSMRDIENWLGNVRACDEF